ncbi:MAG: GrpB family protein [Streptosporangiales bacterium]
MALTLRTPAGLARAAWRTSRYRTGWPAEHFGRVVADDPERPRLFERLRRQASSALAAVEHVTVHIGSTAVPGLDAKLIVDLDVVVADQAAVTAASSALAAAGWQHEGDLGSYQRGQQFRPGTVPGPAGVRGLPGR